MIDWNEKDAQEQRDWDASDKGLSDVQKKEQQKLRIKKFLNSSNPFAALIRSKRNKFNH